MATKFKFEIESDGLTTSQTLAFRTFIGTLGGTDFLEELRQEELKAASEKMNADYAEGIKKDIVEAVENTKKKRASRAKAEEVQAEEAQAEEPQAEEPQAEEPQAEEPQAEEPQAEEKLNIFAKKLAEKAAETKTPAFSIQDVRDRVKEKQVKWRTSIKAELERLGSSSVSLLDPEHFEEFCNFMDNLA